MPGSASSLPHLKLESTGERNEYAGIDERQKLVRNVTAQRQCSQTVSAPHGTLVVLALFMRSVFSSGSSMVQYL